MYASPQLPHHPEDLNWKDCRDFQCPKAPPDVRHWLLDTGSLTEHLVAASAGNFRVELLQHHWQRPLPSECRALQLPARSRAIVREVFLLCHGEPWVFARSVIPARSLHGRLQRLRKFSARSLGQLLFSDRSMRRQPFELARIPGEHSLIPAAVRQAETVWGRRCRFDLANKPILVSEIFLPTFKPWT